MEDCVLTVFGGSSAMCCWTVSGCQLSLGRAAEQAEHIREQMRKRTGDDCGRLSWQDLAETPAGFRLQCRRIPGFDRPLEGANHSFQYVALRSSDDLNEALPAFVRYASRLLARLEKNANALDRGTFSSGLN